MLLACALGAGIYDTWIRPNQQAFAVFLEAIQPGDIVVDIGAHIGKWTVAAARKVGPFGCVYAFEPNPETQAVLAQNLKLNQVEDRVFLVPKAASNVEGIAVFYMGPLSVKTSLAKTALGWTMWAARPTIVETTTVDKVLGRAQANVIKIDAEGAELLVLQGCVNELLGDTFVLCELHPGAWAEFGYNFADLEAFLARYGREIVYLDGKVADRPRFAATVLVKSR